MTLVNRAYLERQRAELARAVETNETEAYRCAREGEHERAAFLLCHAARLCRSDVLGYRARARALLHLARAEVTLALRALDAAETERETLPDLGQAGVGHRDVKPENVDLGERETEMFANGGQRR